jgi:hypothetical protein
VHGCAGQAQAMTSRTVWRRWVLSKAVVQGKVAVRAAATGNRAVGHGQVAGSVKAGTWNGRLDLEGRTRIGQWTTANGTTWGGLSGRGAGGIHGVRPAQWSRGGT